MSGTVKPVRVEVTDIEVEGPGANGTGRFRAALVVDGRKAVHVDNHAGHISIHPHRIMTRMPTDGERRVFMEDVHKLLRWAKGGPVPDTGAGRREALRALQRRVREAVFRHDAGRRPGAPDLDTAIVIARPHPEEDRYEMCSVRLPPVERNLAAVRPKLSDGDILLNEMPAEEANDFLGGRVRPSDLMLEARP